MEDDQQFCLRWNNHQSTLISVFDTLLEKGIHVDCTLAAEGQTVRAHKVVLSACSPYFESVLSQQYDKHPIIILKDVKFAELRAMMDYMYRGEVNISQDQLGALLKAAESLQIKGLSDNKPPPASPPAMSPALKIPCTRENSCIDGDEGSREGSISPSRRKRKKHRSSLSPVNELPRQATPPTVISNCFENNSDETPQKLKAPDRIDTPAILTKTENNVDTNIEPKTEYTEDSIEDSVEDLTMDEEMDSETEQAGAGSSQPVGDGSAQGFGWQLDRSHDELSIGQDGQRDSQGTSKTKGMKRRSDNQLEVPLLKGSLLKFTAYGPQAVLELTTSILSPLHALIPDTGSPFLTPTKAKLIQDALTQNNNIITKEDQDCKVLQKCELESEGEYDDFDDILLPDESEVFGSAYLGSGGEEEGSLSRSGRRGNSSSGSNEPSPQFECRHCGKRYRWKSTLRRHESVECGGKPPAHACPYCPYRAKQRGNLGVHIRKHHNAQWNAFANTKIRKAKKENQSVKY